MTITTMHAKIMYNNKMCDALIIAGEKEHPVEPSTFDWEGWLCQWYSEVIVVRATIKRVNNTIKLEEHIKVYESHNYEIVRIF